MNGCLWKSAPNFPKEGSFLTFQYSKFCNDGMVFSCNMFCQGFSVTLFFLLEPLTFCRASMSLFFSSIWASNVLIPVLIYSCSNKLQFVYLTIISHLASWKTRKFPISEEKKKETLRNFPKVYIYISIYIYIYIYTYLFLTEHNPRFTLFLICFYLFTQSEFQCSYKVCCCKKRACY